MRGGLMHSPVQCLHPEWATWPDSDPEQAKRTRRAFVERHCDTDALICTRPFPAAVGRPHRRGQRRLPLRLRRC